MATSDIQLTVLGLINEVEQKLAYNVTTSVGSNNTSTLLLHFMNDVIQEMSDYGDWQEMYREALVTAADGQMDYKVVASAEVKNILEISHSSRGVSPLEYRNISDINRLTRLGSAKGTPHQFSIVGVSGTRPKFRTYKIPGSNESGVPFRVYFYKKPRLYTASDGSTTVPFPSRPVVQGMYAKKLLEESGNQPTAQYQVAYQEYVKARHEALNRFTADTDTDIRIVPRRR